MTRTWSDARALRRLGLLMVMFIAFLAVGYMAMQAIWDACQPAVMDWLAEQSQPNFVALRGF